jgi:putative aldouronate transport system permease protein
VAAKRDYAKMRRKIRNDRMYYLMFLPVLVFALLFCYAPMVGVSLAFFKFTPFKRKFLGFNNFIDLFSGIKAASFWRAFENTLFLSITNLILATVISVAFALLMNELVSRRLKGGVQTILYLPHFMSWVVVASIFTIILSPQNGFINNLRALSGAKPIYFLAEEKWWTPVYLFICRWRDTGWGTIIYLAALSGISPELYEAAEMDGAGKWRQTISITLPALTVTIITVFILQLGKVMNIFESAFVLQNPNVLNVSDVLTTFAYRVGIQQGDYGMGTAIDLFKSFIGLGLVLITDAANKKIRGSSFL